MGRPSPVWDNAVMSDSSTSTLLATERALRPFVLAATFLCDAFVVALLAFAWAQSPRALWVACACLALLPAASNARYLATHALPTVGMVPVAVFSLLPALIVIGTCPGIASAARGACLVAATAVAALLALFVWWFVRLRRTYHHRPALDANASIIVLGGAIKRGRPCETLVRRLDVAASLWHESPGRTIVVTGGPTPDHRTTEADEMARYLWKEGVALSSIVLERSARNTHENITLSCALLDELETGGPTRQRCVISSDYHLWRAVRDARALGCELTPIPAPTPLASVPQQWCREVMTILSGR